MKVYLVGGAVRDGLLGLPVVERDWVVVGADATAMRAAGYVAADPDFPVYRHPQTGEEYALARRETKTGAGYRGFSVEAGPDVTLEEDLRRRDLTVNAIAQDEQGDVVDPFGGREDLAAGLLRHVSPAFVEDPLRVLRVARFAAKLGQFGFHVAHSTHRLMCQMVERGDMRQLTSERLWREMFKAMQTAQPWRFFEVLHRCGALGVLIPRLAATLGETVAHAEAPDSAPVATLKRIASRSADPGVRLAATLAECVDTDSDAQSLATGICADRVTTQLLRRSVVARDACAAARDADIDALFDLARQWRALDGQADNAAEILVCEARFDDPRLGAMLRTAFVAARAVRREDLAEPGLSGKALGSALALARRAAIRTALQRAGLLT